MAPASDVSKSPFRRHKQRMSSSSAMLRVRRFHRSIRGLRGLPLMLVLVMVLLGVLPKVEAAY